MKIRNMAAVYAVRDIGLLLGLTMTGCVSSGSSRPGGGFDRGVPGSSGGSELRLVLEDGSSGEEVSGTWEAKGDALSSGPGRDFVQMTVVRQDAGRMETRSTTVHGLRFDDGRGGWVMERPAGTLKLTPDADAERTGRFKLRPDVAFLERAEASGLEAPSSWDLLRLVCGGVTPDYVAGVNEGSRILSWAEIIELHAAGVTLEFVRAVREPAGPAVDQDAGDAEALPPIEYSTDDIVMLSFRGVSAEYITGLRDAGYRLSAKDVADMKFRGVPLAFAVQVKKAGYDLSGRDLSSLTFRGVDADYMVRLREAGYRFTPEELADLKFRGVSASYAEQLAEPGYAPLGADEIIKLRFRGVDPELVKALRPKLTEEGAAGDGAP